MAISPLTNAITGFNNAAKSVNDAAVNIADDANDSVTKPVDAVVAPLKPTTNVVDAKDLAIKADLALPDVTQELVKATIASYDAKANLKVVGEEKHRAGDVLNIVG